MPNASEIARSLHEELDQARNTASCLSLGKDSRERALADVRRIERELGIEHEDIVHVGPPPLAPLTLDYQQLKDAKAILTQAISLADVGCIIHALRRSVQHDTGEAREAAQKLLDRLVR